MLRLPAPVTVPEPPGCALPLKVNGPAPTVVVDDDALLIVIATVVGAPFFEELFFRGVILRALARMFGRWGGWVGPGLAIVITGCVFAAVHAEALQFAGLAVFGVILGLIAYRTGRIGMNVVAHAAFNLLALTAVIFPAALRLRGLA